MLPVIKDLTTEDGHKVVTYLNAIGSRGIVKRYNVINVISITEDSPKLHSNLRGKGDEVVSKILNLTIGQVIGCLLYTSPSPRDRQKSRMPSSA